MTMHIHLHRQAAAILFAAERREAQILRDEGVSLPEREERRALRLGRAVLAHARAWEWEEVEDGLDQIYRLLGGDNPATGYAFHLGRHPVQRYLRELERELDPDWEDL
jgi:hypothetical protein